MAKGGTPMAVQYAQLRRIDNSRSITEEKDGEFLYLLRSALLLALLERGELSDAAHRLAVEKLRHQRCDRAEKIPGRGVGP